MSGPALSFAWGLSFSLLALDAVLTARGVAPFGAGASRLGLVLLPWLALAGWPSPARGSFDGGPRLAALLPVALALPLVALGLGLDLAASESLRSPLLALAALGLFLVFAWSSAAECGRRSRAAHRVQAAAWLVLVPGLATVRCALVWAPRGGGGEVEGGGAWAATLGACVSPCVWVFEWMRDLERADVSARLDGRTVVLAGVTCLVWAATSVAARASGDESEAARG